jgi:hypothetical protein
MLYHSHFLQSLIHEIIKKVLHKLVNAPIEDYF